MGRIQKMTWLCGDDDCVRKRAIVDSGADRTLLPLRVARRIGARPTGMEVLLSSPGGRDLWAPEVRLAVAVPRGGCGATVRAVAVPEWYERRVLLGHDFLQTARARLEFRNGRRVLCPARRERAGLIEVRRARRMRAR